MPKLQAKSAVPLVLTIPAFLLCCICLGRLLPNVFAGGTIDTEPFVPQGDLSDSDDHIVNNYLFWANDAAKEALGADFTGTGPDISPCFLMNVLFELCGWDGPGYTKLTDALLEAVPMLHTSGRYLSDGSITDTLPADRRELVEQMQCVQYYLTQDAGGIHPD